MLYVGTGGPGHLDPRLNDGAEAGSQGIKEDPAWEPRLFELFDAIRADDEAALFAVCHTFGVMCRWLGVADAVLRGPEKGGKSSGSLVRVSPRSGLRETRAPSCPRSYTAWHCAVPSPPPADAGSD